MSILIRGMEMPKSCFNCPFRRKVDPDNIMCLVTRETFEETFAGTIEMRNRGRCPLVHVPPHYDLIDHNALKIAVMDCDAETRLDFLKHAMDCINKAPVVIPSDMPTYEAEAGE